MKQLLLQKESEILQKSFQTHPLLLVSFKTFTYRMSHLKSLSITPVDLFREIACLTDYLLSLENVNQRTVDNLWTLLVNDIRKWKTDASEEDKMMVAGTVFTIVREVFIHHWESRFCEDICNMITHTLEREYNIINEKEEQQFLERLTECSESLDAWVNEYEDSDEWLSDEIETCLASFQNKPQEKISGVLDTELAREIFAKCIKNGWMYETENGYQWEGIPNCRGKIAQLAYICGKIYGFKYSDREGKNIGKEFPDAELCKLFNKVSIGKQLVQVYQATNKQKWRTVIDQLFE